MATTRFTLAITTALVLSATYAQAQTRAVGPAQQYQNTISSEERANRLHARAVGLQSEPDQLIEAARLHRMEAKLRHPGDPRAFECLTMASYLLIYSGQLRNARYVMEQAANEALKRGDVTMAARAYVEAAFIAEKQGKQNDVRKFADKAKLLADGPTIAAADHDAIMNRLRYPLAAASAKR